MTIRASFAIVLLALEPTRAGATTIRIPDDYATIQAGIDAAAFGDTVLVSPGLWDQTETRLYPLNSVSNPVSCTAVVFLKDGVVVRSEGGASVTTLSLDGPVIGPAATVLGGVALDSGLAAVEGFTFVDTPLLSSGVKLWGSAGSVRLCVFDDMTFTGTGDAAISSTFGNVMVEDCEFRDCVSDHVGGLISGSDHSLVMNRCRFERCQRASRVEGAQGSRAEILECTFIDNVAPNGAGIYLVNHPDTRIAGCWFEGNVLTNFQGGAIVIAVATVDITGNVFFENEAPTARVADIYFTRVDGTVEHNTFYGATQAPNPSRGVSVETEDTNILFRGNVLAGTMGGPALWIGGQ
ncbi:MAG: right-handed parallel beta-helix repeat-containing protein, partial [bacterium]